MTSVDMKEAAAAYEAGSQYFLNLARAVTPELMDVHAENEWSARQCIHHMADSEAQSYARLRRLVAEPEGSIIQGYDEGAWANEPKLAYADGDVANSIAGSMLMAPMDLQDCAHHLCARSLTELSTQIHLLSIHISGSLLHTMPAHLSIATLN